MKTFDSIVINILFVALFAAYIWFGDIPGGQILLRQHHAESFSETQGKVISADVYTTTGSKGSTFYHPRIAYTYTVAGSDYTNRRYRYDGEPSDKVSVDHIVHEHPPGATVEVYYDPNNPAAAVLSKQVVARNVSILFAILPLNLFFIYGLVRTIRQISRPGPSEQIAGGVNIMSDHMTTRVRLPCFQPGIRGLLTSVIGSLVAGGIIQYSETTSPISFGFLALLLITAAGLAVYFWQNQKITSGGQDLVINFESRTVELPLTFNRSEQRPLRFSNITAVTVEPVERRSRSGDRYTYAPTLQMHNGHAERLTLLNQDRAESFAAWLREKLGVPA